jgi:TetR/AcrR family transcriptional regulator, cholesterol catabolism regulator
VAKEASNIARRRSAALAGAKSGYVDRRREVLEAAAQVFKERGYRGTTLSHVAEAMGTDRASLYYYVSSKDELFQEVVSEAVSVNLAAGTAIRDEEWPAPEKLRRLIEGLMVSYEAYYPVLYVLIQENLSHVPPEHGKWAQEMQRINREYERVVIEIIQAGQDEGTIRDDAPAWLLAYGVIGIVGWTNRWFNPGKSPVSAPEIGAVFADVVLSGVVRRPATSAKPRPRKRKVH